MKVTPTAGQQPICAKKRALPVSLTHHVSLTRAWSRGMIGGYGINDESSKTSPVPAEHLYLINIHLGLFTTSTTSRINAFSSSSTLRRSASVSSLPSRAFRLRRGAGLLPWPAFLFLGCSAAMPPSRYALTQLWTAPMLTPSCRAACFCCMPSSTSSIAFVLVSSGMMGLDMVHGLTATAGQIK